MRQRFLLILLALAALDATLVHAEPLRYRLDPVHTRVMVAVSHAGFSDAIGTLSGSQGEVWLDGDNWSNARVEVTVSLDRLDLGDARWNAAALGRRLLDAKNHPQAHFVSTQVAPSSAERIDVCGNLTLHNATRPLCLHVRVNQIKRHPLPPFRRTAGFSATATLSRKDFGITAWPGMIGDTVELRVEAEAILDREANLHTGDNAQVIDSPIPQPPETIP